MISKATSSVSSMLETVESQLGIPNPVEMAKIVTHADSEEKQNQEQVRVRYFLLLCRHY